MALHQLPIADVDELSSVFRSVLRWQHTQRRAAEALGIQQGLFNRILHGKHRFIRSDIYERIRTALRDNALHLGDDDYFVGDLHGRFEESVLSWEAAQGKVEYEAWLRREHGRLEAKTRDVFEALRGQREYLALFMQFCRRLTRRIEFPPRQDLRSWIAIYRSVEPLADVASTGRVERTWEEMHGAGHLTPYLRAALERERWLLERESDAVRAAHAKPSEAYLADLAGARKRPDKLPGERALPDGAAVENEAPGTGGAQTAGQVAGAPPSQSAQNPTSRPVAPT